MSISNSINKRAVKLLIKFLDLIKSQDTWETLLKVSLKKMNYGEGADFDKSGELNVLKIIKASYPKDKELIIFDVGANGGEYTRELYNYYNKKSSIYSFEPAKKTFCILKENTKEFSNVTINNIGFSDTETDKILYYNYEGSVWASLYQRNLEHQNINLDIDEEVHLTTIDNYCRINKIEKINFLKLDIEGHELNALIGAKEMILNRNIDFIQFEFSNSNVDSKTYFKDFYYFLRDNFTIYRILKNGLFEYDSYQEAHEIFLTTMVK